MRVSLVVPTIRPDSFRAFLAAWDTPEHRFWDALYVVEDNPTRTEGLAPADAEHISWAEIDRALGADSWIISRRDSAIRCFGLWRAWADGADLVITADDDTRPVPGRDFLAEHRHNLEAMPRWVSSVPGLNPRGMPYRDRGTLANVMLSMGLWRGCPDLDAATTLVNGCPEDYVPPDGRWVMPAGCYFPLCGMNLAVRREAVPLLYFGLQGGGWPVGRYDDIFMGIVARKACDHLGWHVVAGRPHVEHRRASDPFRNIVRESAGYEMNERFWRLVDSAPLSDRTAAGCMAQMGDWLARSDDAYFSKVGEATAQWANLFMS